MKTFSISGLYNQEGEEIIYDGVFVMYEDGTIKGVVNQNTSDVSLYLRKEFRGINISRFYITGHYNQSSNEIQFLKFSTISSNLSFFDPLVFTFNGSIGKWKKYLDSSADAGKATIHIEEKHLSYKSILIVFHEGALKHLFAQDSLNVLRVNWNEYVKENF